MNYIRDNNSIAIFLKKSRFFPVFALATAILRRYNSNIAKNRELRKEIMTSGIMVCILVAIGVYLVGMLVIGLIYSKDQSNAGDFYLGGRKLGPIVTALSTEASDMLSLIHI